MYSVIKFNSNNNSNKEICNSNAVKNDKDYNNSKLKFVTNDN